MWHYSNNGFELEMTRAQAESCSHPSPCDYDVIALLRLPKIRRQLKKIGPEPIRAELKEYGAWDETELADDEANLRRIVWIAACDIMDELDEKERD